MTAMTKKSNKASNKNCIIFHDSTAPPPPFPLYVTPAMAIRKWKMKMSISNNVDTAAKNISIFLSSPDISAVATSTHTVTKVTKHSIMPISVNTSITVFTNKHKSQHINSFAPCNDMDTTGKLN